MFEEAPRAEDLLIQKALPAFDEFQLTFLTLDFRLILHSADDVSFSVLEED
jgi:hypothetical protein